MKRTLALIDLLLAIAIIADAGDPTEETPWWTRERIRWFWGTWGIYQYTSCIES